MTADRANWRGGGRRIGCFVGGMLRSPGGSVSRVALPRVSGGKIQAGGLRLTTLKGSDQTIASEPARIVRMILTIF